MLFLALAATAFLTQTLAFKEMGRRFDQSPAGLYFFSAVGMTLATALLIPFGGLAVSNAKTLVTAPVFALFTVVSIVLLIVTMREGQLSLSTLFVGMSLALPVLAGLLFFGERLTLVKGLGLACIFLVIVLSSLPQRGAHEKKASARWLKLAVLMLLSNGFMSVVRKTQSVWAGSADDSSFTFYGFLLCAAAFWILLARALKKPGISLIPWLKPSMAVCMVCMGLGTGLGNFLAMRSLVTLPAIVVYPVISGGVVVLTWLASLLIYGERFTLRGAATMLIGTAGIVLIAL